MRIGCVACYDSVLFSRKLGFLKIAERIDLRSTLLQLKIGAACGSKHVLMIVVDRICLLRFYFVSGFEFRLVGLVLRTQELLVLLHYVSYCVCVTFLQLVFFSHKVVFHWFRLFAVCVTVTAG